jgi:integrase
VRVRRRLRRGSLGPPKSRHGRREIAITGVLAAELRQLHADSEWHRSDDLVFVSIRGTPLDHADMTRRAIKPAAEEAGVGWAGFHTFRHTFASLHIAEGTNIVQVSRALGHDSPAFTLSVYAHLLPGEQVPALDLGVALAQPAAVAATVPNTP